MKNQYIKRFSVAILAIFLLSGVFVFAQEEMKLKLKHNDEFAPIPKFGEFILSLDSQLFNSSNINSATSKPLSITLNNVPTKFDFTSIELPLGIGSRHYMPDETSMSFLAEEKKFSSTLTLTTGYSPLSNTENHNKALHLEKKLGKFKILGEFEKQIITRISLPKRSPNINTSVNFPITRASLLDSPAPENDPQNKMSAMASRYYFEAIYSFKPSFQGKLSYRRSLIDTIESEEKLQVEGIVEANHDVLIKAGYNNKTHPEVNEPKGTKDTKIWTEFILKF